jgi:hypothetical protein
MLCYSFHKEGILHPALQCITVRYRKSNGLNSPTREKLQHGPPPDHGTEPPDDRGRPSQVVNCGSVGLVFSHVGRRLAGRHDDGLCLDISVALPGSVEHQFVGYLFPADVQS